MREKRTRHYSIPGNPIPLARARHVGNRTYNPQLKLRNDYSLQLLAQHNHEPFLTGPLKVDLVFHMKTLAKSLEGLPHLSVPDIDNMIKWVFDAANNYLFEDDSIIVEVTATKSYSLQPRTEITITELS